MRYDLLWIEPTVATCVDKRTGLPTNRKRCPYPRVGPSLIAMLQPEAIRKVLNELQIDDDETERIEWTDWSATIIDCVALDFRHEACFEPELDFYDGPVREYTGLRYGLSTNGLQARLERLEKPDLVAIPHLLHLRRTKSY